MSKFSLKPEYVDCKIHTKLDDGTEVLIDKFNFTDFYAEVLLKNNQAHLININPNWQDSDEAKKKSFQQLTPNVISLTQRTQSRDEKKQSETSDAQKSKPNVGRGRPRKA